jgi:hypothetical protein
MAARAFSRSNGAGSIASREPIPMDQLRKAVPSIFAPAQHESRSAKYTYIPTSQIVEYMLANNYGVFAASQSGSRDEGRRGFTKHMIRFRHLDQAITVGETHPETVLQNAHDGSGAYNLMAGLYKYACSNGLIVSASTISDVKIHHKGDILAEVAQGVEHIAKQLPTLSHSVEAMQNVVLDAGERAIFARAALAVKYDDTPPITEAQVLTVRRQEDEAPTLWNVLNRVQESLIKGGDRYELRDEHNRVTQRRRTQPANSVDGSTRLNRAVWQLAEEMRRLKAG